MAQLDAGSPLANSATGAAQAQVQVTLTPAPGRVPWLTGFDVTASAPAATVSGTVTVTGVLGAPLTYQFVESATFGGEMFIRLPGNGAQGSNGQPITITLSAITSGGAGSITAYGYQL